MTQITEETSPVGDLKHGRLSVGLEAVQLTNPCKLYRGLLVYADPDNTSIIYVGNREALQSSGTLTGFPIRSGVNLVLPIDDASRIYCIADDVDQILHWMAI